MPRTLPRWVLNISREGESTTPLGNLCQCSVTLKVTRFFLVFRWNFSCFSLCLLPLFLLLNDNVPQTQEQSHHPRDTGHLLNFSSPNDTRDVSQVPPPASRSGTMDHPGHLCWGWSNPGAVQGCTFKTAGEFLFL